MRLKVSSKRVRVSLSILLHRLFERGERRSDVRELAIEVFLALGLLLELVDRGKVDLAQLLEIRARARQGFFPGGHGGVGGEAREDFG